MTNIINLIHAMNYAASKKLMWLVMAIDFEKCFDMIDHKAIKGALQYFGIGDIYIAWVMLLFENFELCTQNNGYISSWFKPTRGVHQGCNISPHLFNCTGQLFADMVKKAEIDPAMVGKVVLLIMQFADDTNIFSTASERNLARITSAFEKVERNLGLKINYEKTTLYCIGSLQGTDAKLYSVRMYEWKDPPLFSLGVYVSTDTVEMAKLNLDPLKNKVKAVLAAWSGRHLTLTGRVLVVNTLIESLFVY